MAPPPTASEHPDAAACEALFAHALELVFAGMKPPPPDADRAAIRGELRAAFVTDCRAGTPAYHACGVAAKSVADLTACKRGSANAE